MKIREKIRKNNRVIPFLILLIIFLQFQFHSRVGDDWPNSQLMKFAEWRYGDITPGMFITITWNAIADWIVGQGRFFPVAGFQGQLVLFTFKSDVSLALFYGLFICLSLFLWYKVLNITFQNQLVGMLFLVFSLILVRFRSGFDPHIGFAQLVVWSLFWITLAILILLLDIQSRNFSKWKPWFSAVIYFAALCQYELSIIGLPTILAFVYIALSIRGNADIGRFLKLVYPTVLTAMSYVILVFGYLRPKANPTGNYVAGFDLVESSKIFWNTVFASFPLLGMDINSLFLFPKSRLEIVVFFILMILTIFIVRNFRFSSESISNQYKSNNTGKTIILSPRRFFICVLIALIPLIVGPSMILAIQPNWWGYFAFGNTYLGVYFSEIGVASLISIFFYSRQTKMKNEETK